MQHEVVGGGEGVEIGLRERASRGVRAAGNASATGTSVTLEAAEPFPYVIDGDPYVAAKRIVRVAVGPPVTFLKAE